MPGNGDAGDSPSLEVVQDLQPGPESATGKCHNGPSISKYPELENTFQLHATIGNGGFSKVKMATELSTGGRVAIKIVDKDHVGVELPRIALEIETIQPLCHPHICKLQNVIYSEKKIFMVMEYCPMDLYEYIVKQDVYVPEDEARRIFLQLMSAVAYLHANGIAHRDLKPENILLDYNNDVKLTDFGLCAVLKKNGIDKPMLRTMCGSPAYCAPELLTSPPYIGSKIDVWSLGVILFVLLAGELPFYSKNLRDLYRKIQEVEYTIPQFLSEDAKHLIDRILQPNVTIRPSLNRLWSHPWILKGHLDAFQEQINQSQNEAKEALIHEFGDTMPPLVNYIKSSGLIETDNTNPQILDESETDISNFELRNSIRKRMSKWLRKGVKKTLNRVTKAMPCFFSNSSSQTNNPEEPVQVNLATLCAPPTKRKRAPGAGLNVVDEQFADCILDKLQLALQTMGIPSKRKGSSVKHGVASPCKFKFEILSLEQCNLFCLRRKRISARDPKLIFNIMQMVLLMPQKYDPMDSL